MRHWGNRQRFALWNVCILGLFAAGCTTTEYPERVVRTPVPTISESIKKDLSKVKKGIILVQPGESLYVLARRHGVALRGLIQANKLNPPYVIRPGQKLRLPLTRYHVVGKGDTVYQVARHYDVDMGSLVRINQIEPPYRVVRGQSLRLPDARIPKKYDKQRSSLARQNASTGRQGPHWVLARPSSATREKPLTPPARARWRKPDPVKVRNPPPRTSRKFLWPVRGRIIESFGARVGGLHNDGINIAARKGASIRAAENGVVAYTGNQLQGFGNLVLLKHAGGWMTAYAHSSVILVKRGDIVRRGQTIAKVGRTGNVSKPQLHFELRRGERAVNPKDHLVRIARLMPVPRQYALAPAPGVTR